MSLVLKVLLNYLESHPEQVEALLDAAVKALTLHIAQSKGTPS